MARKQPIELFMPPNMLKAKVGGGRGGPDLAAIKRAEDAMETLKSEFNDWIALDVKKLIDTRARYSTTLDDDTRASLLRTAHDIKGQAPTYNYPLIARVAASLSRMIGELPAGTDVPLHLIDAHVNAIQKSDGTITFRNSRVLPILRIQKNMASGYQIASAADNEGRPNTSQNAFAVDPCDDRKNALLEQEISRAKGGEQLLNAAWSRIRGHQLDMAFEGEEVLIKACPGFEGKTLCGMDIPAPYLVLPPQAFQDFDVSHLA